MVRSVAFQRVKRLLPWRLEAKAARHFPAPEGARTWKGTVIYPMER
jgi:hypothetical protein